MLTLPTPLRREPLRLRGHRQRAASPWSTACPSTSPAGEDRRRWSARSGCGKSVTALSIMRPAAEPPGASRPGASCSTGRDLLALPERRDARRCAATRIGMIFQEPMTSAQPGADGRLPDRRGAARCIGGMSRARGARARARAARAWSASRRRHGALDAVSAPALRRHAPARDDRDGAGLPARSC